MGPLMMFDSLTQSLGQQITERATLALVAPAAAFWGGGLAALYLQDGETLWGWGLLNLVADEPSWLQSQLPRLFELSGFEQFVLVVGVLITSSFAAQRFVLPLLHVAEGYLPGWLDVVRASLAKSKKRQIGDARRELDALRETYASHDTGQRRRYRELDRQLEERTPRGELEVMPTELGNILRAAETRPKDKYGLDVLVCWPRLWLILPESATKELSAARASLDRSTLVCLWGLLFIGWSVLAWWAIPAGLVAVSLAYRSMLVAATAYGSLVEAAFDVYRADLYKHVGWPTFDPAKEPASGEELTLYLWRRPDEPVETGTAAVQPPTGASASAPESMRLLLGVVSGNADEEVDFSALKRAWQALKTPDNGQEIRASESIARSDQEPPSGS